MADYPTAKHLELFDAILKLKNPKEVTAFFRDLMTIKELDDISIRWQIAKQVSKKRLSYQQIASKFKISTTTVTRVAYWLNHGMGGYRLLIKRSKSK